MDLKNKKINFLGDSITEGVGASGVEHIYPSLLKVEAGLSTIRNYGISGTRIARQHKPSEIERFDRYFSSRVEGMNPDADIVVVFGGTNDYGHGDAPLGRFEDRTVDTFYGACHVLMKSLIEKYADGTVVFMTPLHRADEIKAPREHIDGKEKEADMLSTYVNIIKEVAAYYAIPVLDLYSVSGIQPCVPVIREKYCPDGLHPNDAGHKLIASRLKGFLETL